MSTPGSLPPPVAIGGLGGSGTRVFAAVLQAAGLRIGETLNLPLDNLWFTVLFKRAAWTRCRPDQAETEHAARLFARAMTTGLSQTVSPRDRTLIEALRADLPPLGDWRCGAQTSAADSLLASCPAPPGRWGWKEPNTHVFLPALEAAIPGLRYIHVVRDGLDMAFSRNVWQMRHWGHLYELDEDPGAPQPLRQLRYWTASNTAALDFCAARMPGRALVMSYEAFCADPNRHLARLAAFLGLTTIPDWPADLVCPGTIGRAATQDLSIFPQADLAAAEALTHRIAALIESRRAGPRLFAFQTPGETR